ncbi:unnamed protein product [Microthlaspi erraticum]|uniref:HMG box domain-containing protein n=1 Tax=Microthlaspi erraticum TaxID=1685480 RepID=A0A6D2HQU7_9BRAS|nr:unnamed protein product [Microthlaspi erraticum]
MSTETQCQLVPAYGSSSDSDNNMDSNMDNNMDVNSSPSYEDLVRNPNLFWDTLTKFLTLSHRSLKVPIVGGNRLDLHRLFIEVTTRGGLEKVIKERKCKQVIGNFNFKKQITNAAFVLKKYYRKILFEFEHVHYFKEPMSLFWARDEAMNRLVTKSENDDEGTQELGRGCAVNGVIDGKFHKGYFVTVKVGSEELKGVLYKTAETSSETRRYKKKAKLSLGDSQRPKSHRSGYNFFFSEQYRKLKPEYAGQEKLLTKDIGHMWTNLSDSDKKVYQDMGYEDVKRYKRDMSQYKSSMDSPEVEETDAPEDDAAADDAAADDDAAETSSEESQ